jgi:hypothetical protein
MVKILMERMLMVMGKTQKAMHMEKAGGGKMHMGKTPTAKMPMEKDGGAPIGRAAGKGIRGKVRLVIMVFENSRTREGQSLESQAA